jgi:fumarate hydratase class II
METESLGAVAVPAAAYWGAQTQRSPTDFAFAPPKRMPIAIIHALAKIKQVAARINRQHSLDAALADAIETAASEVAAGRFDDEFPLAIWQTGAGTQTNMNVNEVIAACANEMLTGRRGDKAPMHPNDHVNRAQSSNDSFPTALHIATARGVIERLDPALADMHRVLAAKQRASCS